MCRHYYKKKRSVNNLILSRYKITNCSVLKLYIGHFLTAIVAKNILKERKREPEEDKHFKNLTRTKTLLIDNGKQGGM